MVGRRDGGKIGKVGERRTVEGQETKGRERGKGEG